MISNHETHEIHEKEEPRINTNESSVMVPSLKPEISFKKIWFDDDVVELQVAVCDEHSLFTNKVYTSSEQLENLVQDLGVFRNQIHGGLYDIKFGKFGPEFGGGALHIQLHFYKDGHGKLFLSTHQQSDFFDFKNQKVASEAKQYLITQPVQLDNFIEELKGLAACNRDEAVFKCYA